MSARGTQSGFSLIEVLIATAILGVLMTAMLAYQENQMRAQRYLAQKYEAMDLKQALLTTMVSPSWPGVCGCQLNALDPLNPRLPDTSNLSFDSTKSDGSAALELNSLYSSCNGAAPGTAFLQKDQPLPGTQTGLKISGIRLAHLHPVGAPGSLMWSGNWEISLNTGGSFQLHPVEVSLIFNIDKIDPSSKIKNCAGSGGSAGGALPPLAMMCPPNQAMVGIAAGGAVCTPLNPAAIDLTKTVAAPGPGCNGGSCRTYDFGPCVGDMCFTNGSSCDGAMCIACAQGAVCKGPSCCSGARCNGCAQQ